MSQPMIEVRDLGKRYRIHHQGRPDDKLRTAIVSGVKKLISGDTTSGRAEDFWALRNVTFTVNEGEIIGVIGKNGAGKSTLLKILSRITEPTEGEAILRGRVSSLLEVGTGFHPELTGRENIFMNGSILGMSRQEIKSKFDEIVEFSGVEDFLDTPVKRYSSGMTVRLAFAVAAHLDPEILLIDEVLAVGDASFQKKCLGKMEGVAKQGRTVLFVSHNLTSVQNLCSRVIFLDEGKINFDGPSQDTIRRYLRGLHRDPIASSCRTDHPRHSSVLRSIRLLNRERDTVEGILSGDQLTIQIDYDNDRELLNPCFQIGLNTSQGIRLSYFQTGIQHGRLSRLPRSGRVECTVPALNLTPDQYNLDIGLNAEAKQLADLKNIITLTVHPSDYFGTGNLPEPQHGAILMKANWRFSNREVEDAGHHNTTEE